MLEFRCFGSGSSGNCYCFTTECGSILIDAGVGIRKIKRYFRDYGLTFDNIKAIFLTHSHADHVKAVGLISTEYGIPVYASTLTFNGMQNNPCITKKPQHHLINEIEANKLIDFCGLRITPFDVPHDVQGNFGYFIEKDNTNICLITDAGHVTEQMGHYVSLSNQLILEANYDESMLLTGPYPHYLKTRINGDNGHLCNKQTMKTILEYGNPNLENVWLCHLSEENNHPELAKKTIEIGLRENGFLEDKNLEIIALNRTSPTGPYFFEK